MLEHDTPPVRTLRELEAGSRQYLSTLALPCLDRGYKLELPHAPLNLEDGTIQSFTTYADLARGIACVNDVESLEKFMVKNYFEACTLLKKPGTVNEDERYNAIQYAVDPFTRHRDKQIRILSTQAEDINWRQQEVILNSIRQDPRTASFVDAAQSVSEQISVEAIERLDDYAIDHDRESREYKLIASFSKRIEEWLFDVAQSPEYKDLQSQLQLVYEEARPELEVQREFISSLKSKYVGLVYEGYEDSRTDWQIETFAYIALCNNKLLRKPNPLKRAIVAWGLVDKPGDYLPSYATECWADLGGVWVTPSNQRVIVREPGIPAGQDGITYIDGLSSSCAADGWELDYEM